MIKYLLFALFLIGSSDAVCPPASDLLPCTCTETDQSIRCIGIRGKFDIKALFEQVSPLVDDDVVFNKLTISDTSLLEIPAGSIQSLKFLMIDINSNQNLEYISPDAFNATTLVTKNLRLDLNYLSNAAPYERDIFDFFNKFTAIETIWVPNNKITSVPDNAFGSLLALREIDLGNNLISSIGNSTFSKLPNLSLVSLSSNYNLTSAGISPGAFEGTGEQVDIDLTFTGIVRLPESSFKALLDNSARVIVGGRSCGSSGACSYRKLTCDEEALWICKNETVYLPKLFGFLCTDSTYSDLWSYCAANNQL